MERDRLTREEIEEGKNLARSIWRDVDIDKLWIELMPAESPEPRQPEPPGTEGDVIPVVRTSGYRLALHPFRGILLIGKDTP